MKSKKAQQFGCVPYRRDQAGEFEVMLVTSRETRRWIIPKGWPVKGKKPHEAAKLEAFEEAGIIGRAGRKRLGSYEYDKRLKGGRIVRCEVSVFPLAIKKLLDQWPEMSERERRWLRPTEAVTEAGLREILLSLGERSSLSSSNKERREPIEKG